MGILTVAEKIIRRPYRMSGRVAHGDDVAVKWGIQAANISFAPAKVR